MADPFIETSAAREIAERRGITITEAEVLIERARPFWAALEVLGFVDAFGGAEFCRIFPEVIDAIHREANPIAWGEGIA